MIKMLVGEGYGPTQQHPYPKSISIKDQQNFLMKMDKHGSQEVPHHWT